MQVLPRILSDSQRSGRLMRCRPWFLWFGHGAGRTQAVDCFRIEPKVFENFVVMLAEFRSAPCSYFSDTMYLNRTADSRGQVIARTFERNDNLIHPQLWIVDNFLRPPHSAKRDVHTIEDLVPMRH